jgi:hypothetical protein
VLIICSYLSLKIRPRHLIDIRTLRAIIPMAIPIFIPRTGRTYSPCSSSPTRTSSRSHPMHVRPCSRTRTKPRRGGRIPLLLGLLGLLRLLRLLRLRRQISRSRYLVDWAMRSVRTRARSWECRARLSGKPVVWLHRWRYRLAHRGIFFDRVEFHPVDTERLRTGLGWRLDWCLDWCLGLGI